MAQRTGVWHEHKHNGHVLSDWLKQLVLLSRRNRIAQWVARGIKRYITRREIYTLLMGRQCSPHELQRRICNLLLLLAVLVLVLSMME